MQPPHASGPRPPGASPPPAGGRPRGEGRSVAVLAGVTAAVLVGCGAVVTAGIVVIGRTGLLDDPTGSPPVATAADDPIDWFPMRRGTAELTAVWPDLAGEFAARHGVGVDVTPASGGSYAAQLGVRFETGDSPDLYSSAGGRHLRRQVEAGLVRDLTDDLADVIAALPPALLEPYTVDGRIYGLPYHVGTIGVWYHKALFAQAGLDPERPPRTWDDYLAAVEALDRADITPVAVAGSEGWTTVLWYGALATRAAGVDVFVEAGRRRSLSDDPGLLRAAQLLAEFAATGPFQSGYRDAAYHGPSGQAALVATGGAAMELMGSWAPMTYESEAPGRYGDDLGWFPFPTVDGGRGARTDIYADLAGFAVGAAAPDATVDLLRFLFTEENYPRILAADESLIDIRTDAELPKDPNLAALTRTVRNASAVRLFLDVEMPGEAAGELFDSITLLITGEVGPEDALVRITEAWQAAPA